MAERATDRSRASVGEASEVECIGNRRGDRTAAGMAADKRQDAIAGRMPANAGGGRMTPASKGRTPAQAAGCH